MGWRAVRGVQRPDMRVVIYCQPLDTLDTPQLSYHLQSHANLHLPIGNENLGFAFFTLVRCMKVDIPKIVLGSLMLLVYTCTRLYSSINLELIKL